MTLFIQWLNSSHFHFVFCVLFFYDEFIPSHSSESLKAKKKHRNIKFRFFVALYELRKLSWGCRMSNFCLKTIQCIGSVGRWGITTFYLEFCASDYLLAKYYDVGEITQEKKWKIYSSGSRITSTNRCEYSWASSTL